MSTSWKTLVCAQPGVLVSCRMVLLLPVLPMRVCTGTPVQQRCRCCAATAPAPQPVGRGAKRRCDASRHSVGLRRQQPLVHEHPLVMVLDDDDDDECARSRRAAETLPDDTAACRRRWWCLTQLGTRGWRTQHVVPGRQGDAAAVPLCVPVLRRGKAARLSRAVVDSILHAEA